MRYGFILILAAFPMVCGHLMAEPQPAGHETAGEVRVMSWNILRKGWEVEGHASWKQRVRGVVQILREQKPDVVGLQEDGKDQVAYITNALRDYIYVDPHQEPGGGLLIRADAWHVIESGKIPIAEKRQASWALLESTRNDARWLFYNAHLIHRTATNYAAQQMEGARSIVAHMVSYAPQDVPVVFTGDFNATNDMPVMRYLGGEAGSPVTLSNAFNLIHGADDPRATWRGLGNEHHGERIDHILINGQVKVLGAEIIFYDGIRSAYPSDHYPVQATLSTRRLQDHHESR